MTYLVFETQAEAQQALQEIWQLMQPLQEVNAGTGEVVENVTSAWAVEQRRNDGKWVFLEPPIEFEGVKEEYSEDWFPAPDLEG